MKKKAPLNTLTPEEYESRLKKIILSGLGKAWVFWPPRAEVKRRCKDPNKPGWSICEAKGCSVQVIEVDHIEPCIKPSDGFRSWDEYITRRFVFDAKKLMGLCHECHKIKSKEENKKRRETKAIQKLVCTHDDSSWCTDKCPKKRVK